MISRSRIRGVILLVVLVNLVFQPLTGVPPLKAQEPEIDPVREMMLRMSPASKVGQLLLVSFPGTEFNESSPIIELIRDYSIGGLLFTRENGNFTSGLIQASELLSTTTYLQNVALSSTGIFTEFTALESDIPFLPLLMVVRPTSGGFLPVTFVEGSSVLPTPLSLGATWNPQLAAATGEILGRELAALGFNLYLGPDLDVLYTPNPGDPVDLGTRVFGADPFWVGELGNAYITGLHQGSQGVLLVAPRHLPGLGSADRSLDKEVPTVQKPLELLKQIELAPFFTAAAHMPGEDNAADAFLVTHIKYRGFQGNIRQTTRPISLDAHALQSVYNLEEMSPWRTSNGVLIADNLGLPAIHLSYDPRGLTFNSRRVAQDALVAGNDMLILDMFSPVQNWDTHYTNVRDILEYLASRYEADPGFKTVVDAAVYRVLSMKMRIADLYNLENGQVVSISGPTLDTFGASGDIPSQVALEALTRISPLAEDLVPSPPQTGERIVIFTQELYAQEQSDLEPIPLLQEGDLSTSILQFYGPDGTGIVRFDDIDTFTFSELNRALDQIELGVPPTPTVTPEPESDEEVAPPTISDLIQAALVDAHWIIFVSSGLTNVTVESTVLKRFLASQANMVDAHLVVFTFGPPYELDSTEVSKLDLFYALYSYGDAFVDVAARALFSDLASSGASPVDVPAINYFVPTQTMPDPDQVISLFLVDEAGEELTPTARSNIHINDVLNLRTGIIVDRNSHVVPDKTPVQFLLSYPQEGIEYTRVAEAQEGIAMTLVTLDRVGQLHITVKSEPAISSLRLELTIRDDGVTITEVEPTPTPTSTPQPTLTPSPTPTPQPTVIPAEEHKLPEKAQLPEFDRTRYILWSLVGVGIIGIIAFLWYRDQSIPPDDTVRRVLEGVIAGYTLYLLAVICVKWIWPAVSYALISREYLFGILSAVGSVAVVLFSNHAKP